MRRVAAAAATSAAAARDADDFGTRVAPLRRRRGRRAGAGSNAVVRPVEKPHGYVRRRVGGAGKLPVAEQLAIDFHVVLKVGEHPLNKLADRAR